MAASRCVWTYSATSVDEPVKQSVAAADSDTYPAVAGGHGDNAKTYAAANTRPRVDGTLTRILGSDEWKKTDSDERRWLRLTGLLSKGTGRVKGTANGKKKKTKNDDTTAFALNLVTYKYVFINIVMLQLYTIYGRPCVYLICVFIINNYNTHIYMEEFNR